MSYSHDYFDEVIEGLNRSSCTDISGQELPVDSGLLKWVEQTKAISQNRGTLFFCGNGASATMAEHLSHDCFQNADLLTHTVSETSHLTAIGNDISFENIFAYRISKLCTSKDMLVTISSSGNSPNIIQAIAAAREKSMFVVTVSGKDASNRSRQLGNLNFHVPLSTYGLVESAHAVFLHCWLDLYLDKYLNGRH